MTHDQVRQLLQSVAKDVGYEHINARIDRDPLYRIVNDLAIECFLKGRNNQLTNKFREFYRQFMVKGTYITGIEI